MSDEESLFSAGEEHAPKMTIVRSRSHRTRPKRLMAGVEFMCLNHLVSAACFGQFLRFYWDSDYSFLLSGGLCPKRKKISAEY